MNSSAKSAQATNHIATQLTAKVLAETGLVFALCLTVVPYLLAKSLISISGEHGYVTGIGEAFANAFIAIVIYTWCLVGAVIACGFVLNRGKVQWPWFLAGLATATVTSSWIKYTNTDLFNNIRWARALSVIAALTLYTILLKVYDFVIRHQQAISRRLVLMISVSVLVVAVINSLSHLVAEAIAKQHYDTYTADQVQHAQSLSYDVYVPSYLPASTNNYLHGVEVYESPDKKQRYTKFEYENFEVYSHPVQGDNYPPQHCSEISLILPHELSPYDCEELGKDSVGRIVYGNPLYGGRSLDSAFTKIGGTVVWVKSSWHADESFAPNMTKESILKLFGSLQKQTPEDVVRFISDYNSKLTPVL